MGIESWDSNPDNNNAAPPAGAPQGGTLVSDLNNIDRQIMGDIRAWYELMWRDLGLALQPTGGANDIVLSGDQSALFEVNQRVQYLDGAGTVQGTITNISVATNTTLTVDSTVTHPVSQLWSGIKPSLVPTELTGNLTGDVTGNVTGNLNGVHQTGSIASGVTATTQAAGDSSNKIATTQHVTDKLAAQETIRTYREATGQSFTNGGVTTFTHGLSAVPDIVQIGIKCTSADGTWGVGDHVILTAGGGNVIDTGSGSRATGITAEVSDTQVTCLVGTTGLAIMNKTTRDNHTVNPANWEMVCTAIYFVNPTSS